jgi:hypothetical protein
VHFTKFERIPFEDRLFQLISQDFPFLEILHVCNSWPQEGNQHSLTLITFLHLKYTHLNYVARFLLKKNMHLPRLSNLSIEYKLLMLITNNFTNDPTYFNFDKLKSLDVGQSFVRPKNFHQYFPLLLSCFSKRKYFIFFHLYYAAIKNAKIMLDHI